MKKQVLHTVIWREDKNYVAKFLEIEVASQGKTEKEASDNLKEALDLYLEGECVNNLSFPSIDEVATKTVSI